MRYESNAYSYYPCIHIFCTIIIVIALKEEYIYYSFILYPMSLMSRLSKLNVSP